MKFAQISKRIFLFLAVNTLEVLTISLVLSLLGVPSYIGSGRYGTLIVFCLVWGMAGAFISLALSRLMAKWFMGVEVIDPCTSDPGLQELVQMVHGLAQRARLPAMPEVGIYDSPEVNAFATGPSRSRSLVAVSRGLLLAMRPDEVEGVLAHEVTHISNGDMVTMTLLQGVINAFVMFFARLIAFAVANRGGSRDRGYSGGSFFVVIILQIVLGILGSLITAWFSRQREFRADRGGALLAGRDRMIGALRKLAANRELVDTQHQALATLKIDGAKGWMVFFSTHPPIEARIAALERFQG